ncbi:hypothetical protein [Frigoriglobus tundricola]|uniref:Glycosyltransferase RgtA/B/C/D-like domain-containing protein n=1 Tax=Frigoriglobus tundricola TaxID=2774151 RepID=A0A6M5YU47_9BACT|nr:hypothetical protein [Frigoriglobus tundricola]QJW97578.1 hypothetical protein FTUN_5153 [Frigoriglobus tundricola]
MAVRTFPQLALWRRIHSPVRADVRVSLRSVGVAFVFIGLALRTGWYAADLCVWWDEAWLILNVLGKSFGGLTGPLDNNQAAPPAFLWAVKACVVLFGDGTHALRLVPSLASCAALVLVAAVGGGYPRPAAWVAAVLLAGSSKMLAHGAEVKPYTLDACVAAALAVWFCRSADRPLTARLRAAVGLCPLAVVLVYPGCFLAGGVWLGLAVSARRRTDVLLLGLAGTATLAAFALVLAGPGGAQQTPLLRAYWQAGFPDWSRPHAVPGWLLSNTAGIFRYCLYPLGTAFLPLAAIGFASLWRSGRRDVAVFMAGPLALALVAGLFGKYPFSGSRLHFYAAPGLALLVAAGVVPVWDWFGTLAPRRAVCARAALALVVGWGTIEGAVFPLHDAARADVRGAVAFVKTRPAGCSVVVCDHMFLYYLRHESGVALWSETPTLPPGPVWVVDMTAPEASHTGSPLLARDPGRIVDTQPFGPAVVIRLAPLAGGAE